MKQKSLKFLVDVGVSIKVERWLINHGYDTKSVRDINPVSWIVSSSNLRADLLTLALLHAELTIR